MLERWRDFPDRAAEAAMLERTALALNPNVSLFDGYRVDELLTRDGNTRALELLTWQLEACEWALYEVRRVVTARRRAAHEEGTDLALGTAAGHRESRTLGAGPLPARHRAGGAGGGRR